MNNAEFRSRSRLEPAFLAGAGAGSEKMTKKTVFFLLLRIHSFLPYNSPGAGTGAVLFLKGRSRSRRKSGGSETLE